jgi:hypothetical protein
MPEIAPLCDGDFSGHAWVEVGDLVVDATLWSVPEKVRMIEQADPQGTTNRWTLPVLVAEKRAVSDFAKVRDGYSLGAFYQADGAVFNQMEK